MYQNTCITVNDAVNNIPVWEHLIFSLIIFPLLILKVLDGKTSLSLLHLIAGAPEPYISNTHQAIDSLYKIYYRLRKIL